jgi:threonylcarbamoyladenosine tRNA methylthiotransferase MtaB
VQEGGKEIVLTGEISAILDIPPRILLDLLKVLDKVEVWSVTVSSIEPNLLSDEIIDFVAGSHRFAPTSICRCNRVVMLY